MQPLTSAPRSAHTMAPVSPAAKCLVSRKRQRRSQCFISEADLEAAELLSLSDACTSDEDIEAVADCAAYTSPAPSAKRLRVPIAQEIAGMQSTVRLMETQVAQASASMQELRSLVKQLAARCQQLQQQCA